MSMVYLAGPVDDVDATTADHWRDEVAKHITCSGHICYAPHRPWIVADVESNAHIIDLVNREVIKASVAVVANLAGPGRGIGTIREIEYAKSIGRPVLVFVPGCLPPTVALHDLSVVRVAGGDFWGDAARVYDAVSAFLDCVLQ